MDTTARYTEVASALRELPPRQLSRTLDLLARMRDYNDGELWERTGRFVGRTTLNQKRSGRTPIHAQDLWPLADALGVEVDVLLMPPSQAAAWLIKHRAEQFDALETVTGRQGELSKRSGRQRCTQSTLTYLSYRDIVSAERTDLAA